MKMTNLDKEIAAIMELKPCPFCGGVAQLYTADKDMGNYVHCRACSSMTDGFHAPEKAMKNWNRRDAESKLQAQLAERDKLLRYGTLDELARETERLGLYDNAAITKPTEE